MNSRLEAVGRPQLAAWGTASPSSGTPLPPWRGIGTYCQRRACLDASRASGTAGMQGGAAVSGGLDGVERLLRIADAEPALVGLTAWTCAALCACEHLAQLYTELKRRYKAAQARALVQAELRRF